MYKINHDGRNVTKLDTKQFSEEGYAEVTHLQEWISKNPSVFGEELLIIQKEFSDFADTRERLDLLALDKDGNLVIIENKLDDAGKDVVWQALKYTSYCSTLTTEQIIDIYQQYLNTLQTSDASQRQDSRAAISEFLSQPDSEDISLNHTKTQRIFLVSSKFRKEVTSTVLYLHTYGLQIQCFKTALYSNNEDKITYFDIQQILPTPETKDMMINISNREASDKEEKKRHKIRREFWQATLDRMKKSKCNVYDNINPTKDNWLNWLSASSGISDCHYAMVLTKKEVRAELYMNGPKELNKKLFDHLYDNKNTIEKDFKDRLKWMRNDNLKSSKISSIYYHEYDGFQKESWPQAIEWLVNEVTLFEKVFKPLLKSFKDQHQ